MRDRQDGVVATGPQQEGISSFSEVNDKIYQNKASTRLYSLNKNAGRSHYVVICTS